MKAAVAIIAMLAFALVVGACTSSDGVRTVRGDWSSYSSQYLRYAPAKGSLPTMVKGSAIKGLSDEAFTARVLGEMKDRPLGVGPLSFGAMPGGAAKPSLFVALVFNPAAGFDSGAACDPALADQAGGQPQPDGSARVVAAFCSSQRLLSGTVGEASGLAGADDPRLGELIRLVMIDLFPPRDPNLGPSCGSCP